jgi:hypothetical protein
MIVALAADSSDVLAELAAAEATRFAPRTAERRAAAALWTALVTTKTVDAARAALAGFAVPEVSAAAIELLHRLAAEQAAANTSDRATARPAGTTKE